MILASHLPAWLSRGKMHHPHRTYPGETEPFLPYPYHSPREHQILNGLCFCGTSNIACHI